MNVQQKPVPDFSRSAISRYIQLATLFRHRIASGAWPLGIQIPTVDDLAAECGVARATIRQALDVLGKENLIERHRGRGTFVRRRPQEELWCSVGTDWSGLLTPLGDAEIEILSEEQNVALEKVAYPLGELVSRYRHLRRMHTRRGAAFLLTDIHLDERLMDRISRIDLTAKTALQLVHDIPDLEISEARQTLTIGSADIDVSHALSIPLNSPVAFVHRRVVDASGCTILVAEGIYRGDVVRFDLKLR
ncbi:MAG: GntR family transcriptional regulator [Silicimonas sp.]|jgi:GntR family transcriptional regulator|nr:GntR family transcriptional regulator [Silicimonas sp.]